MRITAFCIRRPVTTTMLFLGMILLGVMSYYRLPIDLYPQITFPAISVSTSYSGAGPEEIEQLITIPVEQALSSINKVTTITSVSQEGSSRVTVNFNWGTDLDEVTDDIRATLDRLSRRLPDDAGAPSLFKYDPSAMPLMTIGLSGKVAETVLRSFADDELSFRLQRVDGVAGVDVRGGRSRQIRVALRQDRLQALGLTIDQVISSIRSSNVTQPAGNITSGTMDFLLRTKGEIKEVAQLHKIVVAQRDGVPIFLKDIADILDDAETVRSLVRIDGNPGIVLSVQKKSGSNTVAVADAVYKALDNIKRQYPEYNIRILNDNSTFIRQSVSGVVNSLISGGILAALILLLFLHNIRATVITCISMPIAILATFILAYFGNMTLNTISLGGLALGVGMLVDNSIVVLDNIFHKFNQEGLTQSEAVLQGTEEMGSAIIASTLTTICVFFPLVFLSGRTGIIFKELSYMVTFSLLCSLGVAITLIPMLCAKFLKPRDFSEEVHGIVKKLLEVQQRWDETYRRILTAALKHKTAVILGCVGLFGLILLLWPLLGTTLVQQADEGVISIRIDLPIGTKLEETDRITLNMEQIIRDTIPELDNMEVSVGSGWGGSNVNRATITVRLTERKNRQRTTAQVIADLQQRLKFPGARIRIYAPSNMRMLYGGSQFPIAIDVRGHDPELSREVANLVVAKISDIPGISNASISREEERPELVIEVDRERAADLGITAAKIGDTIQAGIEGKVATIIRRSGQEIQVKVNLQDSDKQSVQDLGRIMIAGNGGIVVPLSSIATIRNSSGPVAIERKDRERNITVTASLDQRDLSSAMQDIQSELGQLKLPQGVNLVYAGDYEEQQKSAKELFVTILLSLALVYMVMASQFESILDPLLIMTSVPFALGGVILMLFLTDTAIDNQVYIGLIILGGVVVNNAIVMISYFRLLMERGIDLKTAVIDGAASRLRPIFMTTATTVLGLVPLALGIGEGSELQAPMARTVIGGLSFSTILVLIIIPLSFYALEEFLVKFRQRFVKKTVNISVIIFLLVGLTLFITGNPAQAETPEQLTIKEAVTLALENSEDGRIILQKQASTESSYRETMGSKGFQLYSQLETTSDDDKHSSTISLNAEKKVPVANLLGIQSLSDQVAAYNLRRDLLALDIEKQNLIYQVIKAYQDVLLAKRDLDIATQSFQRAERFYDEVLTRSKLGLTSITDEMGAATQVANAKTSLARSRHKYNLAKLKFCQWLNIDPAKELELVEPKTQFGNDEYQNLLNEALAKRIELEKAQVEKESAATLLKLAKRSEQLGITLSWDFEREHAVAGLSLSNLGRDNSVGEWQIGTKAKLMLSDPEDSKRDDYSDWGKVKLVFHWTFFDGNVRKERIKQAQLLVAQRDEAVKKTEKTVQYSVEEAYGNIMNQADNLQSSELQLKYNQLLLESTEAKLRSGLASVKDVLDAQTSLANAEAEYEKSKTSYYLAWIELLLATGNLKLENLE